MPYSCLFTCCEICAKKLFQDIDADLSWLLQANLYTYNTIFLWFTLRLFSDMLVQMFF